MALEILSTERHIRPEPGSSCLVNACNGNKVEIGVIQNQDRKKTHVLILNRAEDLFDFKNHKTQKASFQWQLEDSFQCRNVTMNMISTLRIEYVHEQCDLSKENKSGKLSKILDLFF